MLYGIVLRIVRDPAQAEEVTQEAFVELWRQSARFDRLAVG
jgi:RNA polymerase sigma-70 factor, ECF subfamily